MDAARQESLWRAASPPSRHEVQDQLATRAEPDSLESIFGQPVRPDDGLEERGRGTFAVPAAGGSVILSQVIVFVWEGGACVAASSS